MMLLTVSLGSYGNFSGHFRQNPSDTLEVQALIVLGWWPPGPGVGIWMVPVYQALSTTAVLRLFI